MTDILKALADFGGPIYGLVLALGSAVAPWLPLLGWVVYWMFCVNWRRLRPMIFTQGGLIGVVLLGLVAALVWGVIDPNDGTTKIYSLYVSNFVEKIVYVSALICIMFLAGATQLSGFLGSWGEFPEIELPTVAGGDDHGHGDHGHDGHGGHGDDDHGHHPATLPVHAAAHH